MLKELVGHVVRHLVDKPEAVQINEHREDSRLVIEILVDGQDLKRVIGKEGRVVRSIRSLVNCFGSEEKEVILDIAP